MPTLLQLLYSVMQVSHAENNLMMRAVWKFEIRLMNSLFLEAAGMKASLKALLAHAPDLRATFAPTARSVNASILADRDNAT